MKRLQRLSKNTRTNKAIGCMYLLNIGRAVSSNQFEGGGKKRKKVATFVQDLLTQCELHPSQNKELTAGWRCTDINSEKT